MGIFITDLGLKWATIYWYNFFFVQNINIHKIWSQWLRHYWDKFAKFYNVLNKYIYEVR